MAFPNADEARLMTVRLDVAEQDPEVPATAVKAAVDRFGRIDVLVNNAGHGRITNFEETSEANVRELFEVNFVGLLRVTRAVLPVLRAQRSGCIVNIASAAGYAPGPALYHASKFAVTGFSAALAFELAHFGISVVNVAPGLVRTAFYEPGAIRTQPDIPIADYDTARWQDAFMRENAKHLQPGAPAKVARLVLEAVSSGHPPLHLPATADAVDAMQAWAQGIEADVNAWSAQASQTAFDTPTA